MNKEDAPGGVSRRDDHLDVKRNRQVAFTPAHVRTDGKGNITYRPLVRYPTLPCFGLPHRYWRGEFDQPERWNMTDGSVREEPHGCAGCNVRPACGKVAWERVETSPELKLLHAGWEAETQRLPRDDRYGHASWFAFDEASRAHRWGDSHDEALATDKKKRADRERRRRKTARKTRRRRRAISRELLNAIAYERGRRAGVLLALSDTLGAPPYVSKLRPDGCERTADVWEAREVLGRAGVEVTGRAIAEYLIVHGRNGNLELRSLTSRAIEALKRIDRLESDSEGQPVWSAFTY